MNSLVIVVLIGFCLSSGYCYSCQNYLNQLNQINHEVYNQAQKNGFFVPYRLQSYSEKAIYALNQINGNCKQLEEDITNESRNRDIEIEGLESGLTRFQKLIEFLDERNQHQLRETDIERQSKVKCEDEKYDQLEQLDEMKANITAQAKIIKDLTAKNKKLENENKKLQSRITKNSPAIHGQTGQVTGVELPINSTTVPAESEFIPPTTTDEAIPSVNSSSNGSTGRQNGDTVPDIDLRNSNDY
ncbi:uncharacterized protein LOC129758300 [Uranotaenia lowii]|uniref:uncharacterized protein LOC129758300 n=1 Tax=Uranotaenia lowii TaxID=190385 RepID=UPI002479E57C|nr:uncharacterized protein LOC129758300 [Uranotaenia lowii]